MDRLGWTVGRSYVAFGVRFGIRSNNEELLRRMEAILPLGSRPSRSRTVESMYSILWGGSGEARIRRFHIAYANDQRIARDFDLDKVIGVLEPEIQMYVAEYANTRIFVHAGVVEWQGQAILLPGGSLYGKSTLVREFVRAGARFYSDEFAVIDRNGLVHPYPRPITIRLDPGGNITRSFSAEELGGRTGRKPIPVGMVLFTKYRRGRSWRPRRLTNGQTVLSMLSNSLSIRLQPNVVMKLLTQVSAGAMAYESPRDEAERVVRWCLEAPGRPVKCP